MITLLQLETAFHRRYGTTPRPALRLGLGICVTEFSDRRGEHFTIEALSTLGIRKGLVSEKSRVGRL